MMGPTTVNGRVAPDLPTAPSATAWQSRELTAGARTPVGHGLTAEPGHSDDAIVLTWLAWMRWVAIAGQCAAVVTAVWWLGFELPQTLLFGFIGLTAVTNIALHLTLRARRRLTGLAPTLLLVDVVILTVLLGATGGPANPFCQLYLIHVAMAVVVLPPRWTWTIVAASIAGYASLFPWHRPLAPQTPGHELVLAIGAWMAMVITAGVIAYFIGRLRLALQARERQMNRMQETVLQSERLASLATLAAGAAHELGTPLGTIAIAAREMELTLEKPDRLPQAREDLTLIREQVNRCRAILDRMHLEGAMMDDDQARLIEPDAFAQALRQELKPDQVGRLDVRIDPGLGPFVAPPHALQQAVGFLIQNAFDASGLGDHVRLALEAGAATEQVRIVVEDDGPGMPAAMLRRVGEPFLTTKGPHRGMGLGLFLTRQIAEHLSGRLTLESAVGRGVRAILSLPQTTA